MILLGDKEIVPFLEFRKEVYEQSLWKEINRIVVPERKNKGIVYSYLNQ